MGDGKNPRLPHFNISFTRFLKLVKPKPRHPIKTFRVFHKFPTPYYGYYNKFNIDREKMSITFGTAFSDTIRKKERNQVEHHLRQDPPERGH